MKKTILLLLLSICMSHTMKAQSLFKITEKDQDGNWMDSNGNAKDGYVNNRIADINSILMIDFEIENIASSVSKNQGLPSEIAAKITALTNVLTAQKKTLEDIDSLMKSIDYESFKNKPENLYEGLNEIQKLAQRINDISKIDKDIDDIADSLSNSKDTDGMFSRSYAAAAIVLKREQDKLKDYAKEQGISIKFGAWLITKQDKIPLHIDGFDNIAPQQRYEVERWAFSLTPDQKTELAAAQKYAKENINKELNILGGLVDYQVMAIKELVWSQYSTIADQINTEIERLGADPKVQEIAAKAKALFLDIQAFKYEAEKRTTYYKNLQSTKGQDITSLVSKITSDITYFKTTLESIQKSASDLESKHLPSKFSTTFKTLINDLTTDIQTINKLNTAAIKDIIEHHKLDAAALEFSDAVLKLSLADAKKNFEFDLANSGYREEGNRIAFKLSVFDKASDIAVKEQVREMSLFKVLPHVISTVGIIFADPFTSTSIRTQFQMAPYYNLLFKGWIDKKQRRKSVTYNKLLDWGVGLHVSAPDFDKDDVPELGAGIVITALHDYVQTGVAYNIFTGDPYWFFGLRIPTPTFGSNH